MYTTQTYLLMQICQHVNSICEYKLKNIQLGTLKRRTSHTFLIKKKNNNKGNTSNALHQGKYSVLLHKKRIHF